MDHAAAGFAGRMAEARGGFRTRTARQAALVSELVGRLQAGDPEAADALKGLAHRLHGSGGSFGFHDLADAAAELESRIDACEGVPDVAEAALRLARRMAALEREKG